MLKTEILSDGRYHTYSDTFFIRQVATGVVYSDAVDVIEKAYEETDELLPEEDISDAEALSIILGGTSYES